MTKKRIKTVESFREDFIVKSIMDEKLTKVRNPAIFREYDLDGNLITEISYGHGGDLSEKYGYRWDSGKLTEKTTYFSEDEVAETETYHYSGDKIDFIKKTYAEGFEETIRYNYDNQGRIVSKITDEDGEKELIDYDNNIKKIQRFDEDDTLMEVVQQTLNVDGKVISEVVEIPNEGHFSRHDYEYFQDKIVKQAEKDRDGQTIKEIATQYDDDKKPIEIQTIEGENITVLKMEYDAQGNEIGQTEIFNEEISHQVRRNFDEWGNVLETHVEIFGEEGILTMNYSIYYNYQFFEED
ncbi:MAG: hypothetical protein JXR34_02625 [Bacteroidales bacterium]|nr:hypothetical protein [Bacteroidales bacterium]